MPSEAERVRNYRAYQTLLKHIKKLSEHKLINDRQVKWLTRVSCELYAKLKDEFRSRRMPSYKTRGRPKIPHRNIVHPTCKREGCARPSAPGQAYCCREHSPCAYLLERE